MKFELAYPVVKVNTQQAYDRWAATYDEDRNLTRDLDQYVTRQSLAAWRCQTLLELGCGTGKNTSFLAGLSQRVLALDFSPGMLRQARRKRLWDNVAFVAADITRPWPCAARVADWVTANLVLEHVEDLAFVFGEARRVLRRDGRFFISELHPARQILGARARFQQAEETVEIPAFVHSVADFLVAAEGQGLVCEHTQAWRQAEDANILPRLVSFIFQKGV